jgi:hypothetical protein
MQYLFSLASFSTAAAAAVDFRCTIVSEPSRAGFRAAAAAVVFNSGV